MSRKEWTTLGDRGAGIRMNRSAQARVLAYFAALHGSAMVAGQSTRPVIQPGDVRALPSP
jgi:hypothetical protein